jgi:hypothetical protein
VEFRGKTGDVVDIGRNGDFVVVDLYNHGRKSFHSSDVEHNDYAGSDDEQEYQQRVAEDMFGLDPKVKAKIQQIAAEISDIPGYWDWKRDTFTPYGILELEKALDNNKKYVKYALSLTADDDYAYEDVAEGSAQELSIQQLATISDEALDNAYGYGRSAPGNTFGWQANLMSAAYAKKMIDAGVTDIEKISDAIHKGWNVTAQKFVQNPDQFDDTEKLRQAGKLDAKLQQRAKLMKINYANLDNEEQEKDRVVARALLQAMKGQQDVAEGSITPDVTVDKVHDDGHEKEWHVFRGKEMIGYVIKNQPDTSEGLYIAYGHGPGRAFVKEFRGLKSAVNYITSLKEGVAEGSEQKYLWHGSRQKIPMLEPRQSVDTGGAAGSNQNAIYATSDPKVAIAMGLTTPGSDTGMFPNDPQMVLFKGNIRKGENVYLHKVPFNGPDGKPQFVQGAHDREFYSIPGVKGIKPTEIKAVPVDKYLNLIRKATPADLELQKKYMQEGVAEGSFKQTPGQRQYGALHSQLQSLANSGQINTPVGKQKAEKMIDTIQQLVDTDPSCAGSTVPSKKIWLSEQGMAEGSVQDKLHQRHQELRKKSGLPDPDYYKELKATYDLPDQERYAKAAELKKKYNVKESQRTQCPECGGAAYEDRVLAEKQDACYHKVRSRYKVWPSAYASGALVQCRKKGAANWGNKSKK